MLAEMIASNRFWTALLAAWFLTPVLFILVAFVFESRVPPLWKFQSRAFMPGDIFLGVTFACGWYLYADVTEGSIWRSPVFVVACLVASSLVYLAARCWFDAPRYEGIGDAYSPTKYYHDVVLYIGYGGGLFIVCLPALMSPAWSNITTLMVGSLAVWVCGLVYDGLHLTAEDSSKMHPCGTKPLWK